MRVASNPPDSARVQIFARPRRADLETLGRYVTLPDGAFGALLVDLGTLGEIPILDRRGIGRAVEFVTPREARVEVLSGTHGGGARLRLDPHALRALRADLTAALRAHGLHPKVIAHRDAVVDVDGRVAPGVLGSVLLDGVWLSVGREIRGMALCPADRCRTADDLQVVANPRARSSLARPATLRDVVEAPVGALLIDATASVAWRKTAPGKNWSSQCPSSSSPDGWADREAAKKGLAVWPQIVRFVASEPLYLVTVAPEVRRNPPADVVERYSAGGCIWLALALHDRYGWPIYAQIERSIRPYVAHAFVRRPDGICVDVLGPQRQVDRFAEEEREFSRREFIDFVARSNGTTRDALLTEYARKKPDADAVLERYVRPLLASGVGDARRPNPPRREAWQMPLEEFLGHPRKSRVDRREIKPWYSDEARRTADEPFMGGKYRIRRGVDEHGRPLYTVLDGELPVASYDGYQLLVAREYRRRGIATELVADLRERHPEVPPATARTEPAERVQRRAHKLILWRAVLDGKPVPPAAMRGYPDLSRLMLRVRKNGTSRSEKIRERTAAYSLYGVIHPDPVSAFNDIAYPFFDTGYWDALGLDEDRDSSDEARSIIADSWEMLGGRVKGRVFAWHTLDIRAEDRGRGMGRSIVAKMERSLRDMGVSGIILQAGQLDESRHSLPFWEKLGYEEWPLEYGIYDDRVVFKVLQPPGVRINGAERMATFVVDVHDDPDDPDEQGVWQRFWVYARDAENRYSLGMVMAVRRGDHVAGKCRDDRDELRRASGVPRMPVFHVESSFASDQHRATGIGVSLYAEAARVARTRFGAMLVAGDCKHTDETSASAARVWASRRLAEDPRLMVRGHCLMWIGGPQ